MLNSAQHARSAASRLDDVIDRSALEQAREGLGGRDMEEAAHLDSESKKNTFEVRGPALSTQLSTNLTKALLFVPDIKNLIADWAYA